MSASSTVQTLKDEEYINLTTFRKNGKSVTTPVWFAESEGNGLLYVETEETTGKVKRLRHNPDIVVAACNAMGKSSGPTLQGTGRIIDDVSEKFAAKGALHRKYGWKRQLVNFAYKIFYVIRRQPQPRPSYLALDITNKG